MQPSMLSEKRRPAYRTCMVPSRAIEIGHRKIDFPSSRFARCCRPTLSFSLFSAVSGRESYLCCNGPSQLQKMEDSVEFVVICQELNIRLTGSYIEVQRVALWAKLEKAYEIKWEP